MKKGIIQNESKYPNPELIWFDSFSKIQFEYYLIQIMLWEELSIWKINLEI
jgi:hypothetical protein